MVSEEYKKQLLEYMLANRKSGRHASKKGSRMFTLNFGKPHFRKISVSGRGFSITSTTTAILNLVYANAETGVRSNL